MSNIHGHNSFIAFEDNNSASRALSADGNNVTLTESENHPEVTGYGDNDVQRSASSLGDCKLSLEAWAEDTATTGNMAVLKALKGLGTMVSFAPGGSCTGAGAASPVKYTACMVVDDVELRSPIAGIVTCRASLSLRSGSLSKGTWWGTTFAISA